MFSSTAGAVLDGLGCCWTELETELSSAELEGRKGTELVGMQVAEGRLAVYGKEEGRGGTGRKKNIE
jgi:hypothetical protein